MANASINLLSTTARVAVPFIKVTIGQYTFGVFSKETKTEFDAKGVYTLNNIKYPNYVQTLQIEKINGTVNKYALNLSYPVTQNDDPNFFYKVFSSISKTRKIIFSYGDLSTPTFCFRDEEATVLRVRERMTANSSVITYVVTAVSTGAIAASGSFDFTGTEFAGKHKPSDLIKKILFNKRYGLQEVFYGMTNKQLVEQEGLIFSNDVVVTIEAKTNISSIDYLLYLVSCMRTSAGKVKMYKGRKTPTPLNDAIFSLVVMDDTSDKFHGPYFKIIQVTNTKDMPLAYEIDYGYPSQNIVTSFDIDDDEGYTIFYNFFDDLNEDKYVQRINDNGELEEVYAPIIGSGNAKKQYTEAERTWWTKVTQFPIKAKITIRGLLRPAMLMSHVRINTYFWGRKHVSSGLYIVTKQVDNVGDSGYFTTLSLLRVGRATDLDEV